MDRTLQKTVTRYESIGGCAVTYSVTEDKTSWGVSVSVADLSGHRIIHGPDLKIQLLDKKQAALKEIEPVDILGELSSVSFKGITSYFKLAHYFKTEIKPACLSIRLFDFHIISLFEPAEDVPVFLAPVPPPPPPDKCCCVESFDAPAGNLLTNVTPVAGGGVLLQPDPWIIKARFRNNENCRCDACQYRQEIKGQITATQPGFAAQPVNGLPPLDFTPPQQPGQRPTPVYIDPNNFREDTIGDPQNPGRPKVAYGYKPTRNPGRENYRDNDCSYWALDTPEVKLNPPIPAGVLIQIRITFKGYFRDVICSGDKEVKTWDWSQDYTH